MRHKTSLNEQQLAIMTELLLRGKQQVGELRTRASRMVQIDSQDDLRRELQTLIAGGLVRANGPLDRRGIEVDHDLYPHGENHEPMSTYRADEIDKPTASPMNAAPPTVRRMTDEAAPSAVAHDRIEKLESTVRELQEELASVRTDFRVLQDHVDEIRRQLGG
jgi:uncharacterized protein YceH (UPF0502 family)